MTEKLDDQTEWGSVTIKVPPELKGYGPSLIRFFDAMVYKLRRNAHKGKWEDVKLPAAMAALNREASELQLAVENGNSMEALMEAADTANQALIVAEIALENKHGE